MDFALQMFIGSVVIFTAFSFVVEKEKASQRRFFLVRVRNWADRKIENLHRGAGNAWEHFVHYIVKLGWYYSLHSFLRTILTVLVAMYDYIELRFERNRVRARILKAAKASKISETHLGAVAAHKENVSLTREEEEELRMKKLEDLH